MATSDPPRLTLRRPDDWHVHLRDGALLQAVAPATARTFARAIVMPNLNPPITTVEAALAYRSRILEALPDGHRFTPLLTAYLTDRSDRRTRSSAATPKGSSPPASSTRPTPPPMRRPA